MKTIKLLLCFIFTSTLAISVWAGDTTNSVDTIIEFGATNSTLIVSGKFGGYAAGGGSVTSGVEIDRVFKSPKDFEAPRQISVFWFTSKYSGFGSLQLTNSYIFFLRPADGGYQDVLGNTYPFVLASEPNIAALKVRLLR